MKIQVTYNLLDIYMHLLRLPLLTRLVLCVLCAPKLSLVLSIHPLCSKYEVDVGTVDGFPVNRCLPRYSSRVWIHNTGVIYSQNLCTSDSSRSLIPLLLGFSDSARKTGPVYKEGTPSPLFAILEPVKRLR